MRSSDIVPEDYFDCLAIAVGTPRSVAPLSVQELHLFSYLACLLALFEGRPVADWGYRFALTSKGYPFSAEFEAARQALVDARLRYCARGSSCLRRRGPESGRPLLFCRAETVAAGLYRLRTGSTGWLDPIRRDGEA
jgi:hypothetical protein